MDINYVLSHDEYVTICNLLETSKVKTKYVQSQLAKSECEYFEAAKKVESNIDQVLQLLKWK